MRELKCYITKRYNGMFLVTRFQPKIYAVLGTKHYDAYISYGDPIGYINVTPEFAASVFGDIPETSLKPYRAKMYSDSNKLPTHIVFPDNGLYRIVTGIDTEIKNVCSWFVKEMFDIVKIQDYSECVHFTGEIYGLSKS